MYKRKLLVIVLAALMLCGCANTPEETVSTLRVEPATIRGYALTPEENSVPVRITIGVERVVQGEEAYRELLAQNTACPAPDDGQEYIIVTVNVTYVGGELETLHFYENDTAFWPAARVHFNIPNKDGNCVDVTSYLTNPIWGQEGRYLAKGESVCGDIAFLVEEGNTQPLYFEGYGEAVQFQIHESTSTGETAQTEEAAPLQTESSVASEGEPAKTIPFKVFYRGFTPIPLPAEDQETYTRFSEAGTRILQSYDELIAFSGEFCPGIPYNIDVDYTRECLIASVTGFARPTYSCARELVSLKVENGRLAFEYHEETDVYALNRDVSNFYVEILVVNRADLPDGLL